MTAKILTGKRAVVTGASSGMGAAIARRFAAEGADIWAVGGADAEGLNNNFVIDWNAELPYFQCGDLIAFIQSDDDDLSAVFEELCGPPFAQTVNRFPRAG